MGLATSFSQQVIVSKMCRIHRFQNILQEDVFHRFPKIQESPKHQRINTRRNAPSVSKTDRKTYKLTYNYKYKQPRLSTLEPIPLDFEPTTPSLKPTPINHQGGTSHLNTQP